MKTRLISLFLFLPCLTFAQILDGDFEGGVATNSNFPNHWPILVF